MLEKVVGALKDLFRRNRNKVAVYDYFVIAFRNDFYEQNKSLFQSSPQEYERQCRKLQDDSWNKAWYKIRDV